MVLRPSFSFALDSLVKNFVDASADIVRPPLPSRDQ